MIWGEGGGSMIFGGEGEGLYNLIQSYDITWSKMTSTYDNVNFSADLFQPKNALTGRILAPPPFLV